MTDAREPVNFRLNLTSGSGSTAASYLHFEPRRQRLLLPKVQWSTRVHRHQDPKQDGYRQAGNPVPPKALALTSPIDDYEMDTLRRDSTSLPSISNAPNKRQRLRNTNYAIGVALYLVVVVLWTAAGFVTQVSPATSEKTHRARKLITRRSCTEVDILNRFCMPHLTHTQVVDLTT